MTHSKIELGDVLNFFEYEKVRDGIRAQANALCSRFAPYPDLR